MKFKPLDNILLYILYHFSVFVNRWCSAIMSMMGTVYATTARSPYIYRNFTVCTQCMGDNEMRGSSHRTMVCQFCVASPTFSKQGKLLFLYLFCSLVIELNSGNTFTATYDIVMGIQTPQRRCLWDIAEII